MLLRSDVVAAVIDDGKYLLYQRPAGKVESIGETFLSVKDSGSKFVIHFVEAAIDGLPDRVEHADVVWVEKQDLLDLPLAPSDRVFAGRVAALRAERVPSVEES